MTTKLKDIVAAIDAAYDQQKSDKPRSYIGASIIGNPCSAYLSFSLRGFPEARIDPQLKRIFRLGHLIEDIVVNDLKRGGLNVMEVDPMTGKQWAYSRYGGHLSGHADGHAEDESGELILLEIKSMNDNKWNEYSLKGVRFSHPNYYHQCQMMMGLSDIRKTLFAAYNKNNSKYHCEVIEFDDFFFSAQIARVESVMRGEGEKIGKDKSDWRCKGCFKRGACWDGQEVPVECKTCRFACPDPVNGGWHCLKHNTQAKTPCGDYEVYQPLQRK